MPFIVASRQGDSVHKNMAWPLNCVRAVVAQAEVRQAVAARDEAHEEQQALQLQHEAEMRHLHTEHAAQFASAHAQVGMPRYLLRPDGSISSKHPCSLRIQAVPFLL